MLDYNSSILKLLEVYNSCKLSFDRWCVTIEAFQFIYHAVNELRIYSEIVTLLSVTDVSNPDNASIIVEKRIVCI